MSARHFDAWRCQNHPLSAICLHRSGLHPPPAWISRTRRHPQFPTVRDKRGFPRVVCSRILAKAAHDAALDDDNDDNDNDDKHDRNKGTTC